MSITDEGISAPTIYLHQIDMRIFVNPKLEEN